MLTSQDEAAATEGEIRALLDRLFSRHLGLAPGHLDPDEPFFSQGLTSLIHAEVLAGLAEAFGEQSSTVLFEYPNLTLLGAHLTRGRPSRAALRAFVVGQGD